MAAISCKLTSAASTNMPEQVMGVTKRMKVEPVEEMCRAVGRQRASESLRGLRSHRHLNAARSACTFTINRSSVFKEIAFLNQTWCIVANSKMLPLVQGSSSGMYWRLSIRRVCQFRHSPTKQNRVVESNIVKGTTDQRVVCFP